MYLLFKIIFKRHNKRVLFHIKNVKNHDDSKLFTITLRYKLALNNT